MLYGGALASGALAGQVGLFGHHFASGMTAYLAIVIAGIARQPGRRDRGLGDRLLRRPPTARATRTQAARHSGTHRASGALVRSLRLGRRSDRLPHPGDPLVRGDSGRDRRDEPAPLHPARGLRDRAVLPGPRWRRLGGRIELAYGAPRSRISRLSGRSGNCPARGVFGGPPSPLDYHGSPCLRFLTLTSKRSTRRSFPS